MKQIAFYPILFRSTTVGGYIVEQSAAGAFYVWRVDLKGNKIRNCYSSLRADFAHAEARAYARCASMGQSI